MPRQRKQGMTLVVGSVSDAGGAVEWDALSRADAGTGQTTRNTGKKLMYLCFARQLSKKRRQAYPKRVTNTMMILKVRCLPASCAQWHILLPVGLGIIAFSSTGIFYHRYYMLLEKQSTKNIPKTPTQNC